jgi:hypothetical protein
MFVDLEFDYFLPPVIIAVNLRKRITNDLYKPRPATIVIAGHKKYNMQI